VDLRDAHRDAHRQRAAYSLTASSPKAKYGNADEMNYEAPLTSLVWITSIVSIGLTYVVSSLIIPDSRRQHLAVVEAGHDHFLRHARRRHHPELVKVFTSTNHAT